MNRLYIVLLSLGSALMLSFASHGGFQKLAAKTAVTQGVQK